MRMARRCPKLKQCKLYGCGNITDIGVVSLADYCPQLCDLKLESNKGITLMVLLGQKNFSLKRLAFDLWCVDYLGGHPFRPFLPTANEFSPCFPMLNDFSIKRDNSNHLELLMPFIISRPCLQKLAISDCDVTDTIVDIIADSMPELQHLELSRNFDTTVPAIE
ncbi:hypothetical protein BC941DRAFT_220424 [Chlamydoabsidia padenii]|nr:hypothetical protein BC941DRAFT_220424 [Chlamydoabsidia padenii]